MRKSQCYEGQKGVSSSQINARRGSERASGCGNMEKVKKIWTCKIMNGFKREETYFVVR